MTEAFDERPRWHFGVPVVINFASVGLSFIARMLLARFLGPAAFGTFAVWQNNIQLFGTLGTIGQGNYVIREMSRTKAPRSELARHAAFDALLLTAAGGALFGAGGALVFVALQGGSVSQSLLQLGSTVLFALLLTLSAVFRGAGSLVVGNIFDRLVSQILFLLFLVVAGAALIGGTVGAMAAFTLTLSIAAGCSILYLVKTVGFDIASSAARMNLAAQWRHIAPFFLVNSMFVINARYLLTYAGMVVDGEVLGQVGLVFTVVALMIIPVSTLNLIAAPYLAKGINSARAQRVTVLYLAVIAIIALLGMVAIMLGQSLVFSLAAMTREIPLQWVLLLSASFGLTIIGNAAVMVLQFGGRAAEAAKLFSTATAVKLVLGYLAARQVGIIALFWVDIAVGAMFVATALFKILVPEGRLHEPG